jgi:RNA polymerase sigma-70 factor (ECF subfamily)
MKQNDAYVLEGIKAGNLTVFESFFRSHYKPLCYYALRFVNSPDVAEEIVQDLFFTLWEKHETLTINTSLNAYVYASVHNRCMKFLDHRKIEMKYEKYYLDHAAESAEPYADEGNIEEIEKVVSQTLDALPERCSRIFRLNRFEGLKYKDIADKLSISVKTVEANMGKALKMLRKNLKMYVETA